MWGWLLSGFWIAGCSLLADVEVIVYWIAGDGEHWRIGGWLILANDSLIMVAVWGKEGIALGSEQDNLSYCLLDCQGWVTREDGILR